MLRPTSGLPLAPPPSCRDAGRHGHPEMLCVYALVGGWVWEEGGGQIDRLRSGSARAVRTQFCFFRPQLGNVPNRSRSQGHVKTLDHILVSDLPNRSKRDRVAPISTLATQQRSHRVSQSLLACVPCFAAVPFCQISWFMRLLRLGLPRNPRFAAPCYSPVTHKNR